jgi:hypothetical protein
MGPKSVDFEFLECLGSGTYGKVYVEERERERCTRRVRERKSEMRKDPGLRCVCVCERERERDEDQRHRTQCTNTIVCLLSPSSLPGTRCGEGATGS